MNSFFYFIGSVIISIATYNITARPAYGWLVMGILVLIGACLHKRFVE